MPSPSPGYNDFPLRKNCSLFSSFVVPFSFFDPKLCMVKCTQMSVKCHGKRAHSPRLRTGRVRGCHSAMLPRPRLGGFSPPTRGSHPRLLSQVRSWRWHNGRDFSYTFFCVGGDLKEGGDFIVSGRKSNVTLQQVSRVRRLDLLPQRGRVLLERGDQSLEWHKRRLGSKVVLQSKYE